MTSHNSTKRYKNDCNIIWIITAFLSRQNTVESAWMIINAKKQQTQMILPKLALSAPFRRYLRQSSICNITPKRSIRNHRILGDNKSRLSSIIVKDDENHVPGRTVIGVKRIAQCQYIYYFLSEKQKERARRRYGSEKRHTYSPKNRMIFTNMLETVHLEF